MSRLSLTPSIGVEPNAMTEPDKKRIKMNFTYRGTIGGDSTMQIRLWRQGKKTVAVFDGEWRVSRQKRINHDDNFFFKKEDGVVPSESALLNSEHDFTIPSKTAGR
jgi:hypothetical protein